MPALQHNDLQIQAEPRSGVGLHHASPQIYTNKRQGGPLPFRRRRPAKHAQPVRHVALTHAYKKGDACFSSALLLTHHNDHTQRLYSSHNTLPRPGHVDGLFLKVGQDTSRGETQHSLRLFSFRRQSRPIIAHSPSLAPLPHTTLPPICLSCSTLYNDRPGRRHHLGNAPS